MVLEYCQYGSLHSLSIFTKPYDEPTAFIVMRQVALALKQCHAMHVLHLDLNEANILVNFKKEHQNYSECGNLPIEFKLADWGVSRDLNLLKKGELSVFHRGTPRYMAPE